MINQQLKAVQKCFVCGTEALPHSHFCSDECAAYWYEFLANEMLKDHIIQNVIKKDRN